MTKNKVRNDENNAKRFETERNANENAEANDKMSHSGKNHSTYLDTIQCCIASLQTQLQGKIFHRELGLEHHRNEISSLYHHCMLQCTWTNHSTRSSFHPLPQELRKNKYKIFIKENGRIVANSVVYLQLPIYSFQRIMLRKVHGGLYQAPTKKEERK